MVTNRVVIAAQLRRLANRLDRLAWTAERDGDQPERVKAQRQAAQQLRRLAHRVRPTTPRKA